MNIIIIFIIIIMIKFDVYFFIFSLIFIKTQYFFYQGRGSEIMIFSYFIESQSQSIKVSLLRRIHRKLLLYFRFTLRT